MSNNPFCEVLEIWIRAKETSIKTGDWNFYKEILLDSKKELSKLFSEVEEEWKLDFLTELIKTATCELKEINIKYKKNKLTF